MVCEQYNEALNEVAAGGPASAALDIHLRDCTDCRSRLEQLRRALAIADEQLLELAAIEPSAAFLPRLRAAVAAPAPAGAPVWRRSWLWPSLATAATLAAVAIVLAIRTPHQDNVQTIVQYTPPAATPAAEPGHDPASADAVSGEVPPPRRRVSRRIPVEPQVLVPSEDSRALAELVAVMNHERVAPTALLASGEPMAPLAAPTPIHIPPIEIVPLDPVLNPGT